MTFIATSLVLQASLPRASESLSHKASRGIGRKRPMHDRVSFVHLDGLDACDQLSARRLSATRLSDIALVKAGTDYRGRHQNTPDIHSALC